MFVVGASYISLLQSVANRCSLPYVSTIREFTDDGSVLYGIELQMPAQNQFSLAEQVFFWAYAQPNAISGYKRGALQAVHFLQSIYGFVVLMFTLCWCLPSADVGVPGIICLEKLSTNKYLITENATLCASTCLMSIHAFFLLRIRVFHSCL